MSQLLTGYSTASESVQNTTTGCLLVTPPYTRMKIYCNHANANLDNPTDLHACVKRECEKNGFWNAVSLYVCMCASQAPECSDAFYSYSVFVTLPVKDQSQDSAVGIATGYGLDDQGIGVRVSVGSKMFSSPQCPDRL
jgi:hypothetical protein